ncbi:MAG: SRPBCC domain-containing protein [Deltaproteobacteria bacterium]|nr:MAG: SRPBCC domain-containing protein [Deltaproteobacteria bacterium]
MTDELTLTVRRVIAAPPARLFAAWTQPALLRVWWGPRDVRCIAAEVDLRIGGAYRLGNQLPDGRVVWITGAFESIDPPHRLVYSWQIGDEPQSRVTVQFAPLGERTEVTVLHERIATPAMRDDHARGWDGCLDGLLAWAMTPA